MQLNLRTLCVCLSLLLAIAIPLQGQEREASIWLKIVDAETRETIPAAVVRAGREVRVADADGAVHFPLKKIKGEVMVVECVGYLPYTVAVKQARKQHPFVVRLQLDNSLLSEVTIEGKRNQPSKSSVAQSVGQQQLQKQLGSSLAASLAEVKGMSSIQSGATIAKPVLHGMYGNRLLIINNGVRQQGQQWGDDHAPEVDVNSVEAVHVIKGAEAVRYGADALGGVIRLEPKALPYGRKRIEGSLSLLYGSNGHRYAVTGDVDGSLPGASNWAWRLQGTLLNGGDRSTADYLINNTGAREYNGSASVGYRGRKYGVELFYSRFQTLLGVFYNAQAGNANLLKERIELGRPLEVGGFTRHIDYPKQEVVHHLAKASAYYQLPNDSRLTLSYAYQLDKRNEYHQRRNNLSHVPGLSLTLASTQTDLGWKQVHPVWGVSQVGVSYTYADNRNRKGTGVVPIIPNYTQQSVGAFALHRYEHSRWGGELGVRYDYQRSRAAGIDSYQQSYGGQRKFSNFTYNVGGYYQVSPVIWLTSNLGMAWRAPHVFELYSNGVDHASGMYVIGDTELKSERSTKWITSLKGSWSKLSFSVDGYVQWLGRYIYDSPTQEFMTVISGAYPIFRYRQTDAFFRGFDVDLGVKPLQWLHYRAGASMVWAHERKTGAYLPFIPSFRMDHSLRFELPTKGHIQKAYVELKHQYVAKQHRFNPASDLMPDSPPAYHLLGAEAGLNWNLLHGRQLNFLLESSNLLNTLYKEYTNRFRYYAHDLGRDIRVLAIWKW